MSWITQNWVNIVAVATSLVTVASIVARMTPNTHDDDTVNRLLQFVQWLSINGRPKE